MAAQITIYNFASCSFGSNFSIKTTVTIKLHTGNNITVIMSTVSYVKYLLQLFKFKVILKKKGEMLRDLLNMRKISVNIGNAMLTWHKNHSSFSFYKLNWISRINRQNQWSYPFIFQNNVQDFSALYWVLNTENNVSEYKIKCLPQLCKRYTMSKINLIMIFNNQLSGKKIRLAPSVNNL